MCLQLETSVGTRAAKGHSDYTARPGLPLLQAVLSSWLKNPPIMKALIHGRGLRPSSALLHAIGMTAKTSAVVGMLLSFGGRIL